DYVMEADKPLTVPLGRGLVDLKAVVNAAMEAGSGWLIVEQDECREPALESIRVSRDYLKGLGL
ncbi:MAG TPA: sugar phosphate isomerase/epimerase, partial [Deinococcales bacterium]|nr:sugar phosphate isomerase/epimerase [Deinococcales bacterium]